MGELKMLAATHKREFHSKGWYITFETPNGEVCLWSCWLGNRFFIGYPSDWDNISDEFVKEMLHVKNSEVSYGKRRWAKFYSDRVETGGRVWIDHTNEDSYSYDFPLIDDKRLAKVWYGHNVGKMISTSKFSYFSNEEPDEPTAQPEAIQPYRDQFIRLAIEMANKNGGIKNIHIKYALTVLEPEELNSLGYGNIEYLKGNPGYTSSWGGTVIYANKENEEIILETANSLVPWVTNRKVDVSDMDVTVKKIHHFLTL